MLRGKKILESIKNLSRGVQRSIAARLIKDVGLQCSADLKKDLLESRMDFLIEHGNKLTECNEAIRDELEGQDYESDLEEALAKDFEIKIASLISK